ncbi:hypothetical protein C8R43DRAFT_906192, partial [Mycena crocata]
PVLTLPNEIVAEIFLHFLPDYPECPSPTGLFSPTILTHICRKWREIACATPSLWRAIQYPVYFDDAHGVHTLKAWLLRSCSCPISLISKHDSDDTLEDRVIKIFLPHR